MLDSSKPRTTTRVYLVIPDAWDAKSIKCLTNNLKQDKTTSVTTLGPCALNTLNAKLWKRSLRRIVSKFFLSLDDSRTNLVEYLWNTQTIKRNLNIYSQLATTALRASAARSGSEGIRHFKIRFWNFCIFVLNLPILICQILRRLKKYANLANFD